MATVGKIQLFLINYCGDNYKTTFYGFVSKLSMLGGLLMLYPDLIDFLPPTTKKIIFGVCTLAYFLFGVKGNSNSVDVENVKPSSLKCPLPDKDLEKRNQI